MRKRLYSDRCWRTIAVSDRLVIFIYVHQGAKFKWNPTIKSGLLNNSLAPWRITLSKQAQLEAYSSREPGRPLPFHLMTAWVGNPQPAKPVPLEYLQGPFLCRRSWAPHHLLAGGLEWAQPPRGEWKRVTLRVSSKRAYWFLSACEGLQTNKVNKGSRGQSCGEFGAEDF